MQRILLQVFEGGGGAGGVKQLDCLVAAMQVDPLHVSASLPPTLRFKEKNRLTGSTGNTGGKETSSNRSSVG